MTDTPKRPRTPQRLGAAGRGLWRSLVGEYEFTSGEMLVLGLAARQADDVAKLELLLDAEGPSVVGSTGQSKLSPTFGELRQSRLALARLVSELALPADDGETLTPQQRRARKAAMARWRKREVARGAAT